MSNMPCFADIAARDYAHEEALYQRWEDEVWHKAAELESWPVQDIYQQLKPHEKETIDGIVATVAERLLRQHAEERAEDYEPW